MDPRKNDFSKACLRKLLKLCAHIGKRAAADRPASIRDDAVSAEAVTPLLDFEVGARSPLPGCGERLKHPFRSKVGNSGRFLLPKRFHKFHHVRTVLCSDHEAHAGQCKHLFRCALGITPRNDDLRRRGKRMRPGDHLPRFFVARLRHGTGVHNINIRRLAEIDGLIPRVFKKLPHRFGIVLVYLAPKCAKGCFHCFFLTAPAHKAPSQALPSLPFRCAGCVAQARREPPRVHTATLLPPAQSRLPAR